MSVTHIKNSQKTDKPWGYEVLWACPESGAYVAKIMSIESGKRMSLQYHNKKEETVYIMAGVLRVWESENDEEYDDLPPGSIYHVKPKQVHRFGSSSSPVTLMEVSTNYLEDVIRLKDDYERK